jgi:hypothetical protein
MLMGSILAAANGLKPKGRHLCKPWASVRGQIANPAIEPASARRDNFSVHTRNRLDLRRCFEPPNTSPKGRSMLAQHGAKRSAWVAPLNSGVGFNRRHNFARATARAHILCAILRLLRLPAVVFSHELPERLQPFAPAQVVHLETIQAGAYLFFRSSIRRQQPEDHAVLIR